MSAFAWFTIKQMRQKLSLSVSVNFIVKLIMSGQQVTQTTNTYLLAVIALVTYLYKLTRYYLYSFYQRMMHDIIFL